MRLAQALTIKSEASENVVAEANPQPGDIVIPGVHIRGGSPAKTLVGARRKMGNGRKGPVGRQKGRGNDPHRGGQMIYISPAQGFASSRLATRLRYAKTYQSNNAGVNVTNFRFNPVYAYDVDPILGSTALTGFAEYAALYRFYRVQAATITVAAVCDDNVGLTWFYICPTNYDPGANHSRAIAIGQVQQPRCGHKHFSLFSGGKPMAVLTKRATTADFGGAWDTRTLDNYCAPTSGSSGPANSWYFDVGFICDQVLANGYSTNVLLEVEIEFFELTNPAN